MLHAHIRQWAGHAVRHLPYTATDPRDFTFCAISDNNRWNAKGQPTLYLAIEKNVALAEYARHLQVDRSPDLFGEVIRRRAFRFQLEIAQLIDLRDAQVLVDLSITDAPACFLDKVFARATAEFIRQTTDAQALLVPSVAFLDNQDIWVLVVFLEKIAGGPAAFIRAAEPDGFFDVTERPPA